MVWQPARFQSYAAHPDGWEAAKKREAENWLRHELRACEAHINKSLQSVHQVWLILPSPGRANSAQAEGWESHGEGRGRNEPDDYVTLDQAAGLVNRSKKTLERYLNHPKQGQERMPQPDVEGTGGKPHEWKWSALRPWLERNFERPLPERLPSRASRPIT